jgi:hypothetical protein
MLIDAQKTTAVLDVVNILHLNTAETIEWKDGYADR